MALRLKEENYRAPSQALMNVANRSTTNTAINNSQSQNSGTIESVLGGLGNTIGNVGRSLLGLFGTGAAAVRDLAGGSTSRTFSLDEMQDTINKNRNLEGADQRVVDSYQKALDTAKANGLNQVTGYWDDNGLFKLGGEGKNQSEFKKWLYGENEDTGTANYARAAGESLDAASTLSNFIPGANGLVGNTLQGAASGFGQAYADTGGNLEAALKSAAAGGAAGLATGGLNKGLNKLASPTSTKYQFLKTLGRGALSGAVGGAVGGGTAAGLNNGDILAGAAQGAGSGLGGGLIAAPVMYGTNKLISKTPLGGIQSALNEMEQDYQTAKQNGQRYYGFGSDNKAETAPGSIKDTYVAGNIVEGAEKAADYTIDKLKNPMLGMGLKDVSNDNMTWGQQDIANARNRNLDKIDTVIEEGEFSDWGGTKNNPLFKKLVKSGALVANPADPDDTFEGSYITNPNRTLTNEEMRDIAQLLREEGYGGIDKNGKYNSDLDLNLEEMPQVSPDQTSFFEGQNMEAKAGKLIDVDKIRDEQARKFFAARSKMYDETSDVETDIPNKPFKDLSAQDQESWLKAHSNQVLSKADLQKELKAYGIETKGLSRLEMLRIYDKEFDKKYTWNGNSYEPINTTKSVVDEIYDLNEKAKSTPGSVDSLNKKAKNLLDSISIEDISKLSDSEAEAIKNKYLQAVNSGEVKTYREVSDNLAKAGFALENDPKNSGLKQAYKQAEREYNDWNKYQNELDNSRAKYRRLMEAKDPRWFEKVQVNKANVPIAQEQSVQNITEEPTPTTRKIEVNMPRTRKKSINVSVNTPAQEPVIEEPMPVKTQPEFAPETTETTPNRYGLAYGESELAGRTAAQNRGNMLQRLGEVMEGAQSNTTRVQNRKLGIKSAGNAIDKVYKRTGISDLDVQTELAKELTGGPKSYLDEIQRTALSATEDGSTRTVDTSDIARKVEPLVDSKISETNLSGKKRQQFITSLRRDVQKGDTITAANNLKEQAQVLLDKKENMTPLDKQQAKVYRELANDLDDLSYNAVPKDNVDAMFETAISESRGRSEQAKRAGNQQIATAYEKIANDLEKLPRTIQAFRSFKKDFVDVAKMGELSALGEQAVLAQNGANITGNLKRFVNKALQKPTNQALAWAGSKISDAGEKMASSNSTVPNTSTQAPETLPGTMLPVDRLGNAIGRAEGARAAGNSLEAQLANMNTQAASQATQNGLNGDYYAGATGNMSGNALGNATLATGNTTTSTGNNFLDRLSVAMEIALEAGDLKAVSDMMDIYSQASKIYGLQSGNSSETKQTKLTATQQRANAAANSLQRLANMTPDSGYAVSGIPVLGDLLNMRGNSYLSEAQSLAQQIGYMVSGANIKKEEAEAIGRAYVPQPFDSEQIRNEKLQRAAEIIAMYQNGYAEE